MSTRQIIQSSDPRIIKFEVGQYCGLMKDNGEQSFFTTGPYSLQIVRRTKNMIWYKDINKKNEIIYSTKVIRSFCDGVLFEVGEWDSDDDGQARIIAWSGDEQREAMTQAFDDELRDEGVFDRLEEGIRLGEEAIGF